MPDNTSNASSQRALRWAWQQTDSALVEAAVFHVARCWVPATSWPALPDILLLALASLALSRLHMVLDKLYLVLCLTATSIEDKATRSAAEQWLKLTD